MNQKLQFGLYWGKKGFGLAETKDKQILRYAHEAFDTPLGTESDGNVPDELKYTALFQKAYRANNIQSKQVNISLNDKDFIFRSFVIPWMPSHEVKNVVDFEATKYIPIPLENLTYAFHSETISENNQKNLLILFFAARKDITQNYSQLLEDSGTEVVHIEPAPVSLIRVLQKHNVLVKNQATAILILEQGEGKIIIVEHDTVQFVRDIQIPETISEMTTDTTKIFNNIRVSLNFYSRQNPNGKINNLILLSLLDYPDFALALTKEFDKPVTPITAAQILGKNDVTSIDVLYAYGIALRDQSVSAKNFELGEKAKTLQKDGETALIKFRQYKIMAVIIAGSLLFICLIHFVTNHLVLAYRNQLTELEGKQGKYSSLATTDIQTLNEKLSKKLLNYKDISVESNIRYYMQFIPTILPEGTWLNKIMVKYNLTALSGQDAQRSAMKPTITLDGYAYHKDPNEQFRLVNNLVGLLKKDTEFSKTFTSIDRENMQQSNYKNYMVTRFQITCK
jgi:hypothetical protein